MRHNLSFAEALNLAMVHEMESDPDVFAFGVDCSDFKRTFGSGKGLIERFGPERYFGSPVSEAGATGIAIGAALSGLRPIHIHARADFMLLTMNQLVNMASCKSYLSNGTTGVPLTVRAMIGRSWGQGPQHSKAMHSTYAHFPGLKVALPSNAEPKRPVPPVTSIVFILFCLTNLNIDADGSWGITLSEIKSSCRISVNIFPVTILKRPPKSIFILVKSFVSQIYIRQPHHNFSSMYQIFSGWIE